MTVIEDSSTVSLPVAPIIEKEDTNQSDPMEIETSGSSTISMVLIGVIGMLACAMVKVMVVWVKSKYAKSHSKAELEADETTMEVPRNTGLWLTTDYSSDDTTGVIYDALPSVDSKRKTMPGLDTRLHQLTNARGRAIRSETVEIPENVTTPSATLEYYPLE